MIDAETVARFIKLRAEGWSFARIAIELNVSKPTLIDLGRKHQFQIQNLRAVETEALAEEVFACRKKRWEIINAHLARVEEELAKRTLDTVSTSRLLTLASRLRSEVSREVGPIKFSAAMNEIPRNEQWEEILDWQV